MSDLINGRTPEHIKAGLRCRVIGDAKCSDCAYYGTVLYEIGQREYECDDIDRDALALIEHLESERDAALAKVPKWISVKERMPKTGNLVLVTMSGETRGNKIFNHAYELACYYRDGEDEEGVYHLDGWELWDYRDGEVLNLEVFYWMPLPEPPEEDTNANQTD